MFWLWWTTTESSKGRATGELSRLQWCNHLPVKAMQGNAFITKLCLLSDLRVCCKPCTPLYDPSKHVKKKQSAFPESLLDEMSPLWYFQGSVLASCWVCLLTIWWEYVIYRCYFLFQSRQHLIKLYCSLILLDEMIFFSQSSEQPIMETCKFSWRTAFLAKFQFVTDYSPE